MIIKIHFYKCQTFKATFSIFKGSKFSKKPKITFLKSNGYIVYFIDKTNINIIILT